VIGSLLLPLAKHDDLRRTVKSKKYFLDSGVLFVFLTIKISQPEPSFVFLGR
jgi:hypothetical protein